MKFSDKEWKVCVLLILCLLLVSGCSHLTPVLIVNYTNEDVTVDLGGEIFVPIHAHTLAKVYLGGGDVFLKVTSSKKTLTDRILIREEIDRSMVSDDLTLYEVK